MKNRTYSKRGPGRFHGQGKLTIIDNKTRIVKAPVVRLESAKLGGNWKGKEYFTYQESDEVTRLQLAGRCNYAQALAIVRGNRAA